jgi:long-subunit fatty acid transport protein
VEYQFENFKAMRVSDDFGLLKNNIKRVSNSEMKATHTVKIGAQVNATKEFAIRGGFAFVSSPTEKLSSKVYSNPAEFQNVPLVQPQESFYYTGGLGYRNDFFYVDLAYVHAVNKQLFYQYLPQNGGPFDLSLHNNNIMATVGFLF